MWTMDSFKEKDQNIKTGSLDLSSLEEYFMNSVVEPISFDLYIIFYVCYIGTTCGDRDI